MNKKQLAREIAKYPDHRFKSNIFDSKFVRLSFYLDREFIEIKELEEILKKLKAGEDIVIGAFL